MEDEERFLKIVLGMTIVAFGSIKSLEMETELTELKSSVLPLTLNTILPLPSRPVVSSS